MSEPWAFVAHKNGKWLGAAAADAGIDLIKEFYTDQAGNTITPVYSRDEFNTFVKSLDIPGGWKRAVDDALAESGQ